MGSQSLVGRIFLRSLCRDASGRATSPCKQILHQCAVPLTRQLHSTRAGASPNHFKEACGRIPASGTKPWSCRTFASPSTLSADEDVDGLRSKLVSKALKLVPTLGWSSEALEEAAVQLGYSPSLAGVLNKGPAGLVLAFNDECIRDLAWRLKKHAAESASLSRRDRVVYAWEQRLEQLLPYRDSWGQAMALLSLPSVATQTGKQYMRLADVVWRYVGDDSLSLDWYSKRTSMAALWTAAELYSLTDTSPNLTDTKAHVQRLARDLFMFSRQGIKARMLAGACVEGAEGLLSQGLGALRFLMGKR